MRSGYIYNCSAGETWDSVALEVYGDEKYAADILGENPALCGTMIFTGTETLYLPVVTAQDDGEPLQYTPANAPWKD